jgi:hypothetical protein
MWACLVTYRPAARLGPAPIQVVFTVVGRQSLGRAIRILAAYRFRAVLGNPVRPEARGKRLVQPRRSLGPFFGIPCSHGQLSGPEQ